MRLTSYEKRGFGLDGIRHMMHIIYVDNVPCPSNFKIAVRGIDMQAAEHNGIDVQCNYCKGVGYLIQD